MRFSFYYWPLPFRGNFVRELFAYAEVPFNDISGFGEIERIKTLPMLEKPVPFVGPPILLDHKENIGLSQATAIVVYVAEVLELIEASPHARARLGKAIGDAIDVLSEITRSNGSQMWDKNSWDRFYSERLPMWLSVFEHSLDQNAVLSAVDVVHHALWATIERCLPGMQPIVRKHAPVVLNRCDQVGLNPGIRKLVGSQQEMWGRLYCGGQIEESIRTMLKN